VGVLHAGPGDPQNLLKHFSGIVMAGPVEPPTDRPKPNERDFHYPDDIEVFFHSWCAPRVRLPEKIQEEFAEIFATAFLADYRATIARWAKLGWPIKSEGDLPRFRATVASTHGRRVFTMTRGDWQQFRSHESKVVEMVLERVPGGSLDEHAAAIAGLAAECSVDADEVEVWRYNENEPPGPLNVQEYLVLEKFTRQINLPKFAERVSTQDTPRLRKHLRDHVFLVKAQRDKGRWAPKAQARERIVFMAS
jgi:hypothetical protein